MGEPRTLRSKSLRAALFVAADGRCQMCGEELGDGWHADHVVPWVDSGETNVHDMQALCGRCNRRKGRRRMQTRKFWRDARGVAVTKVKAGARWMTCGIECGAGKSSLPAAIAYDLCRLGVIDAVVWLVPRLNLARQAAKSMHPTSFVWKLLGVSPSEARKFEINHLENGNVTNPSAGKFGYAVSYDSVASCDTTHRDFFRKRRVLLVADEVQFCAKGSSYGNALEALSSLAAFRVYMSGDFDREDGKEVACVPYEEAYDEEGLSTDRRVVACDVLYNLEDALGDRSILPIDFAYGSGSVVYMKGAARKEYASFQDAGKDCKEAVWAALHSDYAKQLLTECVESWRAHRTTGRLPTGRVVRPNPGAQLMVVCARREQARAVQDFMVSALGFEPSDCPYILSDMGPEATNLLSDFCARKIPVAITVGMAYVGTDAPGITHLCVLAHYRSKSWLHQLLARLWRLYDPEGFPVSDDYAVAYVPDDPPFIRAVSWIRAAEQVGVSAIEDGGDGDCGTDPPGNDPGGDLDRALIVAEDSALTGLVNKYEFWPGDPAPIVTPAPETAPAPPPTPSATREALTALGYAPSQVDAMLAALAVQSSDPVDPRLSADRIKSLTTELESYQRATAVMVAKATGKKPDFKAVNKALIELTKLSRSQMHDESILREVLAKHAPALRSSLLRAAGMRP